MTGHPETERRIREAAFRALVEHGYADLSMTDIGDELGQNPSLIYHYFDSKDDLLLSMLEVFVELFMDGQAEREFDDPTEELRAFVDQILHPEPMHAERIVSGPPSETEAAVSRLFVELWGHAQWDPDFREKTTAVESRLHETLAETIRNGIEREHFRPVDPELTADHILFVLKQGVHTHTTTNRDDAIDRAETLIDEIIDDISRA
ncbi:TetR/AcrR family transcriptional regulator [Halostagnicola kamekurae]|uniref:DNA-binding transcriptional regulator, AcrR family n=1 Tax=Halostagnicola kamekurae TaxID=619731 RepID=A0A1I6UHR8_9EURY|nr:TetR/AcrR family transcriptional regulator [Halostagnicola kamekurae]SFT00970.1 DNA-binding transcriptional regulator, AcrR family [Halostagnicola kamekurae]